MRVVAIIGDLIMFSRVESAAASVGATVLRVDAPADLPSEKFDLIIVDWSMRAPEWSDLLNARSEQLVLFGQHTDLAAHAAARALQRGPMWARSKLLAALPKLMSPERPT